MKLYFAYGSNMNSKQMEERCPDSSCRGTGSIDGHRFIINSRGVASIVPDVNSMVHGLIWEISEEDELVLDKREGVSSNCYSKVDLLVKEANGKEATCLVYIASDQSIGKPRLGYLEKIIQPLKDGSFPECYVLEIEGWVAK